MFDHKQNSTKVYIYSKDAKAFRAADSIDIQVGDIILVENESSFPSDVVLLGSSHTDGTVYVSTVNLDGESGIKVLNSLDVMKQTEGEEKVKSIRRESTISKMMSFRRSSNSSTPQDHIEKLQFYVSDLKSIDEGEEIEKGEEKSDNKIGESIIGQKIWRSFPSKSVKNISIILGEDRQEISQKSMAYRGFFLKHTKYAIGLVTYTGRETLMMQNFALSTNKSSKLDKTVNFWVFIALIFVFISSIVLIIMRLVYYASRDISDKCKFYFSPSPYIFSLT